MRIKQRASLKFARESTKIPRDLLFWIRSREIEYYRRVTTVRSLRSVNRKAVDGNNGKSAERNTVTRVTAEIEFRFEKWRGGRDGSSSVSAGVA